MLQTEIQEQNYQKIQNQIWDIPELETHKISVSLRFYRKRPTTLTLGVVCFQFIIFSPLLWEMREEFSNFICI